MKPSRASFDRPPQPKFQLLLGLASAPGEVVAPLVQLPLQRMTRVDNPAFPLPYGLGSLAPLGYMSASHELNLWLALGRRWRAAKLAAVEQVLRRAIEELPPGAPPVYLSVKVYDMQGQLLHQYAYHGRGCWRLARISEEELFFGDTLTFSTVKYF